MNIKKILVFLVFALNILAYSQNNPLYIRCPRFENKHWLFSKDEYDTLTNMTGSWTYVQPMQKSLMGVTSYYRADVNKIFICGGLDSGLIGQTACYYYNISNNTYELKDSLPEGRWSGNLLRVRDSLYLVGSVGANFNVPDGKIFRYSINTDSWVQKSLMPTPYLIESASCVFQDSLIICVGGSSSGFQQATAIIRTYDPKNDAWGISPADYPITTTTAHAECNSADSTIVVLGGYGAVINDVVYKGRFDFLFDSVNYGTIFVTWRNPDFSPFPGGVYRVSGGKWNDMMLFGPGIHDTTTMGQIYGLRYFDDTTNLFHWLQFLPDIIDSNANIPQIAVDPGQDTTHFYFFGGTKNLKFTSAVKEFTVVGQPIPIGITPVSHLVPKRFMLYQNYPNPFNPSTVIKFQITGSQFVKLSVYDILGREVAVLINERLSAGTYSVNWNAGNYASGIYFYTLLSGDFRGIKKMVLVK